MQKNIIIIVINNIINNRNNNNILKFKCNDEEAPIMYNVQRRTIEYQVRILTQ